MAKYGIEAIAYNEAAVKRYMGAQMYDEEKRDELWYKEEPAFTHFLFVDEPGTVHYDELRKSMDAFRKHFPDIVPYINLLPMYANDRQLSCKSARLCNSQDLHCKIQGKRQAYHVL